MTFEIRCADGRPCAEVIDRLAAADRAEFELGFSDAARRLRAIAARFAEVHGHGGSTQQIEEAS